MPAGAACERCVSVCVSLVRHMCWACEHASVLTHVERRQGFDKKMSFQLLRVRRWTDRYGLCPREEMRCGQAALPLAQGQGELEESLGTTGQTEVQTERARFIVYPLLKLF